MDKNDPVEGGRWAALNVTRIDAEAEIIEVVAQSAVVAAGRDVHIIFRTETDELGLRQEFIKLIERALNP